MHIRALRGMARMVNTYWTVRLKKKKRCYGPFSDNYNSVFLSQKSMAPTVFFSQKIVVFNLSAGLSYGCDVSF